MSKWLFGAELAGWPGQGVGVGTGAVVGGSENTDAEFKGYPCQGWPVVLWWLLSCVILMLNCLKSGYSAV